MVQSPGPAAGGTSLPGLLHELSDVLVASSSGVGANVDVEMRMREVVVHVVEKIVPAAEKSGKGGLHARSLASLAKMLNMTFVRFPALFSGDHKDKALYLVLRLLPVMAEPRLDDAIPGLLDAMATLLLGTAEALDASERLLADVLQLFDDLAACRDVISAHPDAEVSLDVLGGLRGHAAREGSVGEGSKERDLILHSSVTLTSASLTPFTKNACVIARTLCGRIRAAGLALHSTAVQGLLSTCALAGQSEQGDALRLLHAVCSKWPREVAWASVSDCLVQSVTAWSGMGGVPQPVVNAVCAILSVAAGISGAVHYGKIADATAAVLWAGPSVSLLHSMHTLIGILLSLHTPATAHLGPALASLLPHPLPALALHGVIADSVAAEWAPCGAGVWAEALGARRGWEGEGAGRGSGAPPRKRARKGGEGSQEERRSLPEYLLPTARMIGAATKDAASRLRDHSGSAAAAQGAAVILCLLASTGSPEAVDLIGDALQKALAKRERRLPAATASALRMLSCVHVSAAAALGAPLRISKAAFAVLCDVPGEGGGQSGAALLEWADAAALAVCLLPSPDVPRVWEALSAAAAEASQAEDASQREAVILGAAVVALACRLRHLGAAAPSTTWREEGEGGDAAVADHESRLFEVVARAETGGSGTVTLLACCRAVEILASADATRPALPQVLSHLSVPLQARISGAPRLAGSMHELLAATFATLATHAMASEAQSPKEPITAGLVEIGEKSAGRAAAQGTGNAALWQSMLSRAIAADDPTGRLQEAALLAIAALVRCADPAQSPLAALMRPCAELAKSPHAHVHGALSTLLALCPPGCLSAISSDDATSAASGASKQGGAAHSAVRFLRQMLAADGVRSDPQRYAGVLRAVAAVTARVPKEEEAALVTGVVTLLSALDEPSLGNAALTPLCCEAGSLLSQLAASRGSTLAGLLRSLPLMLEYVARNLTSKPAIFLELADLVASEDPRGTEGPATSAGALAELMLPHVLPRLVALGDSQAGNLRRLAVHLGLGGSDPGQALLRERLHLALMVLFRDQRDGGDLEATRAFLKGAVVGEGSPEVFDNLLSLCAPKLFWEVLWATAGRPAFESLGEDLELPAEEVGECGRTLAAIANLMHRPGAKTGKRKAKRADGAVSIEEFLTSNGRIMQMMHYAGDFCDGRVPRGLSRMDNCPCSLEDTLRAVRLLPLLVHFLSRRLPDVVPQISALLTRAIETRDAAAAASRAPESVAAAALAGWATLVRCLAQRAPEELARVASHIVVVLLPLLEVGAASRPLAARVLRLLVVEHGPTIGADALRRLPPLPAGDGLEDISDALTRARGGATVRDRVELLLTGLTDEALSVRLASLSELRHNLCSSPTFVSALVDTDASRDSQLSALVSALLVCVGVDSRTALGRRIQHRSAECLGLIGAVDPSRVSLSIAVRFEVSRDPADFMKTLVERFLVRLLRASSGLSALANTMLAIQTLLDIGRAEGGGDAGSLFDSLSDAVKPLVKPFLSSKFVASDAARTPPREVLFAPGIELRPWLSLWIRQLSEASRGVWAGILAACRGVFAHDVPLMLFVLPNAVYQALQGAGQDAADMIRAEITAVLTTACRSPASVDPLVLQAVFGLLDVLSRYWWLHLLQQGRASSSAGTLLSMSAVSAQGTPEGLVRWVLDAVPHELRARASFAGGAHVRAQLYYETHLREANGNDGAGLNPASARPGRFSAEDAAFFHSICSRVGDPDGLASAAALHPGELPVEAQIALAEGAGAHSQALALYAQAARRARAEEDEEKEWELRAGRLRCLLGMGSPEQVLAVVDGVAATGAPSHHSSAIAAVGASAAWRMSRWDALDELLDAADGGLRQEAVADLGAGFPGPSLGGAAGAGRGEAPGSQLGTEGLWELRVGSALLALRNGDQESIRDALELARKEVLRPLSAASMESYARVYPLMVKLHVLQEIEDAAAHVTQSTAGPIEKERKLRWDARMAVVESTLVSREPILSVRRQLAELLGMRDRAGQLCVEQARVTREAGHLESARALALEGLHKGAPGAALEHAELLWDIGATDAAMKAVEGVLAGREWGERDGEDGGHERAVAAMKLARWKADTGQGAYEEVTEMFRRSISLAPKWWRPCFELARYTDALMEDSKARQAGRQGGDQTAGLRFGSRARVPVHQERGWVEYAAEAIGHYASALKLGADATFQALPRMLTVFFHLGSHVASTWPPPQKPPKDVQRAMDAALASMEDARRTLPVYVWLSCMPQLVSRVLHRHQEVCNTTHKILIRTTGRYPHQALWMLASSLMSNTEDRKKRTRDIVEAAKQRQGDKPTAPFDDFAKLHRQLLAICNKPPAANARRLSFSNDFKEVEKCLPADVVLPVLSTLTLTLPPDGPPVSDSSHVPFPTKVTMTGVRDGIDLLQSLMRPKKIRVLGSDGNEYAFLAKPKDDLRKDTRMMEMAGILNRVFRKDPRSRRRNMKIRTFCVTPLTEDSGLVEWVARTAGFRHCCQEVYILDGRFDRRRTNEEIKRLHDKCTRDGLQPSQLLDKILQGFPPRFHRWFLSRFPEPAAWLRSRSNFTVTAAVWSMVGHIMGLGDRHGENILVDSASGDVVMIDFSCLFDKGLTLEKPELVPFRLTQNVIDAMGVAGTEGPYRRVCEMTLAALRSERDTIMSVAETFVHDPLVDWSWKGRRYAPPPEADRDGANPAALDALRQIQGRITGTLIGVQSAPSLSLSVEGHVHRLIQEACDKENLGGMYIWWMPWF